MINKIIVTLLLYFLPLSAFAAQNFAYKSGSLIKAEISSKGVNRIEFGGLSIAEVIGDESKYSLVTSKEGTNIFITPKVASGSNFSLTLISASGLVQDLELVSSNIGAQSIVISISDNEQKKDDKDEITKLLKTMKQGVKGKYYVKEHNVKLELPFILEDFSGKLQLLKQKTYHFKDLTGVILEFRNNGKGDVVINSADFKEIFANTLLVRLSKQILPPRSKAQIFIIVREERDDR